VTPHLHSLVSVTSQTPYKLIKVEFLE